MSTDDRVPDPPYQPLLRFLDHQLTAADVAELTERLRADETARTQAAALLLQIGVLGELARNPGEDQLPARRSPPPPPPVRRRALPVLAGICLAAAALIMLVELRKPAPAPPAHRPAFARPAPLRAGATAVPPGSAGRALLVGGSGLVGSDASDRLIVEHLEALGFEVAQAADSDVTADQISERTLVVISASTSGRVLRQRMSLLGLREAPVPVVTCESSTFDLLGMTGPRTEGLPSDRNGFGSKGNHQVIEIEAPNHPLAAGLRGPLRIASAPVAVSWGFPAPGAIRVARLGTGRTAEAFVQFAYDEGAPMVGTVAPARRVACFISADAGGHLTPEAWQLFDAGVRWASARLPD